MTGGPGDEMYRVAFTLMDLTEAPSEYNVQLPPWRPNFSVGRELIENARLSHPIDSVSRDRLWFSPERSEKEIAEILKKLTDLCRYPK